MGSSRSMRGWPSPGAGVAGSPSPSSPGTAASCEKAASASWNVVMASALDTMAGILDKGTPSADAITTFHEALAAFSQLAAVPGDDGEGDPATPAPGEGQPRMLRDEPTQLFERYRDALQ